jgi:hypothetical protein
LKEMACPTGIEPVTHNLEAESGAEKANADNKLA